MINKKDNLLERMEIKIHNKIARKPLQNLNKKMHIKVPQLIKLNLKKWFPQKKLHHPKLLLLLKLHISKNLKISSKWKLYFEDNEKNNQTIFICF